MRTASTEAMEHGSATAVLASAFRDLTNHAAEYAIIMLQPDGRIASWNSAAEHIFGFASEHVVGRSFACLYPHEDVEAGIPEHDLAVAVDLGTTVTQDTRRCARDGTTFRARVSLAALLEEDGSRLGFIQVVQRNDRQRSSPAQKYADTLAKADLVLRAIHDVIIVQDASGAVLYANDAAARAFGLPDAHAMMCTPLEQLSNEVEIFDEEGKSVDPADRTFANAILRGSGEPVLLYIRVRRTNEARWWLARTTLLRDEEDRPELVVHVGNDVTDAVHAREAARSIADATRVLSASLDYATTLRTLTEALVPRLADWTSVILVEEGALRQVAVAHCDCELAARARGAWSRLEKNSETPRALATVLRTGRAQLYPDVTEEMLESFAMSEEHLMVLRQSRLRSIILAPIMVCGRTDGVLAVYTVESKRHYDRGDLELVAEIGRRAGTAIEHARLFREAQQAVRLRDEFLSIAAHELRTPLAALTLQLESLRMAIGPGDREHDREQLRGRIDKTLRQSNRLARLVDGLLDVSRIAGGQLDLRRENIDLCAIVSSVCERFAESAQRAGSELSFTSSGPCFGSWDRDRLDQVIANLVSNAIKYGQRQPVSVHCSCDEAQAVVTVRDHGIGIAPENLSRIFGRFERAVSERNYGGLGLGLWIAQEIAEAHGGRVDVTSLAGEGALFRLVLPSRSSAPLSERRP